MNWLFDDPEAKFLLMAGEEGADGADAAGGGSDAATADAGAAKGAQGDAGKGDAAQSDASASDGTSAGDSEAAKDLPWYGEVDDDLKKVAERFTSPADALRSIMDMRKRESQVRVPGKNASDEERAAYFKAIGVPEKPEGYEFPALPDDQMTDEVKASREQWAKTFHETGVTKEQAAALTKAFNDQETAKLAAQVEADKQFAEQSMAALTKEWGPDKDKNLTLADRALADLANRAGLPVDELKSIETKAGQFLLDDARMARLLAIVGREMQEGTLGGAVSGEERDTIQEQISGIRAKIGEAQDRGDSREANRLHQQELALLGKITRNQPIVGSQGRAA